MYGIFVATFAAIMFIYLDVLNNLFQTANLGGYWWLPFIISGVIIYFYTETSRKWARENPRGWWARNMQW